MATPGLSAVDTQDEDKSETIGQTKAAPLKITKNVSIAPISGGTPVSSSTLENLQKMYDERVAQRNSFMEGLRDAQAWWSGGLAGPGEALARRAEERNTQAGELFNMQNAIAQLKAQQELNKNVAASLRGAGGAGTGVGAGAVDATTPDWVQAEINRLLDLNDIEGAKKFKSDWMKGLIKGANEAAGNEPKPTFIKELGYNLDLSPNEFRVYSTTGKLPNRYADEQKSIPTKAPAKSAVSSIAPNEGLAVTAGVETGNKNLKSPTSSASGEYQMTKKTFDLLKSKYPDALGAYTWEMHNADSPAGKEVRDMFAETLQADNKQLLSKAGVPMTPIAERAAWFKGSAPWIRAVSNSEYHKDPISKYLTADELKANGLSGNMTVGEWKADQEQKMKPYQVASTGTTPPAPSGAPKTMAEKAAAVNMEPPRNKAEVDIINKLYEEKSKGVISGGTKAKEKAGTEEGARQGKMEELAKSAETTIEDADLVENMAKNKKHIFGVGKGFTPSGVATKAAEFAMPWKDKKAVEDMVAETVLSREDIADRDKVKSASDRLGIAFAADVFKGARMGIGLEKMAVNAKGVGAEFLPETNILNASIIREAAKLQRDTYNLWVKYKETHGGDAASFSAFEGSPEYTQLKKETKARLLKKFPNQFKPVDDEGETSTSTPSKFDKFKKQSS